MNGVTDWILTADIGNSRMVFGLFLGQELRAVLRTPTAPDGAAANLTARLLNELAPHLPDPRAIRACCIVSVVPSATPAICLAMKELTGKEPLLADRSSINLPLLVRQPDNLGTDRILAAWSAARRYPCPIIVMDLGTATTLSVVDGNGCFAGGAISPGLLTSARALHVACAQLPELEPGDLEWTGAGLREQDRCGSVIGASTDECIRSGLIYGTAAMLEGLIDRIEEQLGTQASRIITGGLAGLVKPFCRRDLHHEPDLILQGLAALAQMPGPGGTGRKDKSR